MPVNVSVTGGLGSDVRLTPVMEMPMVEIEHVNLWYGEKQALRDVNMSIPKHRITAYIGPSGCGKSTLLRCLNRMNDLVDDVRVAGSIRIGSTEPSRLEGDMLARAAGSGAGGSFSLDFGRGSDRELGSRQDFDHRIVLSAAATVITVAVATLSVVAGPYWFDVVYPLTAVWLLVPLLLGARRGIGRRPKSSRAT